MNIEYCVGVISYCVSVILSSYLLSLFYLPGVKIFGQQYVQEGNSFHLYTFSTVATMVVLACPLPTCEFRTDDVEVIGAAAILNIHALEHSARTPSAAATAERSKGPKLDRPKVDIGIATEQWNAFLRRWETFRTGSDIAPSSAPGQLFQCATEKLGDIILRAVPNFTSKSVDEALHIMRSFAVIPVSRGVLRSELAALRQEPDEQFRTFAARVQGKAEACDFKTKFSGTCGQCGTECSGDVYYTNDAIRDVLLNGIADIDIRREALGTTDIQDMPINNVIAFIEGREMARNANPSPTLSAISSYRRTSTAVAPSPPQHISTSAKHVPQPSAANRAKTASCKDCGKTFHVFTERRRGWNTKPHECCVECWRVRRERLNAKYNVEANAIADEDTDSFGQISGVAQAKHPPRHRRRRNRRRSSRAPKIVTLSHHIFSKGEWRRSRLANHPRVHLNIAMESSPSQSIDIDAIADSGAQSNLWSLDEFLSAGFSRDDLSPVNLSLNAANRSVIKIDGAFFTRIQTRAPDGNVITCHTMTYVSSAVKGFYLSYETMLDLGILGPSFPTHQCPSP